MTSCPEIGPWTGLPCIRADGHHGDHRNHIGWTWGPGLAEGDDEAMLPGRED